MLQSAAESRFFEPLAHDPDTTPLTARKNAAKSVLVASGAMRTSQSTSFRTEFFNPAASNPAFRNRPALHQIFEKNDFGATANSQHHLIVYAGQLASGHVQHVRLFGLAQSAAWQ